MSQGDWGPGPFQDGAIVARPSLDGQGEVLVGLRQPPKAQHEGERA